VPHEYVYAPDDYVLRLDRPTSTVGYSPKLMQPYITAEPAQRVPACEVRCFISMGLVTNDDQTEQLGFLL